MGRAQQKQRIWAQACEQGGRWQEKGEQATRPSSRDARGKSQSESAPRRPHSANECQSLGHRGAAQEPCRGGLVYPLLLRPGRPDEETGDSGRGAAGSVPERSCSGICVT